MRPYILKGHERPLTMVKYNREGDLLFTTAKDNHPTVWWARNGERIGTYMGHNGAVWGVDISYHSDKIVTAGADNSAILWETETGTVLKKWNFKSPVRAVSFVPGDEKVAVVTAALMGQKAQISLWSVAATTKNGASEAQEEEPLKKFTENDCTMSRLLIYPTGDFAISADVNGVLKKWDMETGKEIEAQKLHEKQINDIQFSRDSQQIITASSENKAKLVDTKSLKALKSYGANHPINSASISPIFDHIILGGGQEAAQVTTTTDREGKFEAKLYHKLYEEEIGRIKGHFGPINTITFSPNGHQYVSGGEEGYVRLHNFDKDYLSKHYI